MLDIESLEAKRRSLKNGLENTRLQVARLEGAIEILSVLISEAQQQATPGTPQENKEGAGQ